MYKGGGFGGGGFNMQGLMKQAQKMQEDMARAQEDLENERVTASVSGGLVEVTLNGKKKLIDIKIKKEAVDPDDIEMLEDLIKAAFSDAFKKAEELAESKMPKGMNGLM